MALVAAVGCSGGTGSSDAAGSEQAGKAASDARRKITVAGDSLSFGLGSELRGVVPDDVVVKLIGEGGTGLARPDKFDWPTRLKQLAADFPPSVLMFSVGSNDAQDLTDAKGTVVAPLEDTAAWDAEYSKRLGEVFDAFSGTGTTVVWVGQARTAKKSVGNTNRRVQTLAARAAAGRPWVKVADLGELLGYGESTAVGCMTEDGVHLEPACYKKADKALLDTLDLGT